MSRQTLTLLGLIILISALPACSTVKGWLKPWVCECDAPKAKACPADTHLDDLVETSAESEDEEEELEEADLKTGGLPPRSPVAKGNPYDHATPEAPAARQELSATDSRLRDSFAVKGDLAAPRQAFRGRFSLKGIDELLVIDPDGQVGLFNANGQKAKRRTPRPLAEYTGIAAPYALEAVRDGRLEVAAHETETEDDRVWVHLVIYKVIGREITVIFNQRIGEVLENKLVPSNQVRYLRGDRDIFVEVVPVVEGSPVSDKKTIFHWNHWEGMFRIPRTAPTSPKRS